MEIKAGRYATMKDGRTILIEKTDEAGGIFGGKEISSPCMPYVVAHVKDIDHIAKLSSSSFRAPGMPVLPRLLFSTV